MAWLTMSNVDRAACGAIKFSPGIHVRRPGRNLFFDMHQINPIRSRLLESAKLLCVRLGIARTRYQYMLEPNELLELMLALRRGEALEGDIVEIGVARGKTTIFLNRYLDSLSSRKTYFAIDTFSGFTKEDVAFEQETRGKSNYSYYDFSANSQHTWEKDVLDGNGIRRVKVLAQAVEQVVFVQGQKFSTALLDVDLYLPTMAALELIYPRMVEGGTVVVDDVREAGKWDGAYKAFSEFVARTGTQCRLVPPKCGILTC